MRKEQDIFEDLASLCTSPGYVHTIVFLCFRDNIVPYHEQITAEDMLSLFSPERLLRTEISTLLGLLVKSDIDYKLPEPHVTQRYVQRTDELLSEIHRAIVKNPFSDDDLKDKIKKGFNPFTSGDLLREPIFYGGESAYWFQYRDLAPKKYFEDNQWLMLNKRFSITDAKAVLEAVVRLHTEQLEDAVEVMTRSHPDTWTLLPASPFRWMSSQGVRP
jgi:hypothetical protein